MKPPSRSPIASSPASPSVPARAGRHSRARRWLPMSMLVLLAAGVLPATAAVPGSAVVRTSDGTTLVGSVRFVPDGLSVVGTNGEPVIVPLAQLVELALPEARSDDGQPSVAANPAAASGAGDTNASPAAVGATATNSPPAPASAPAANAEPAGPPQAPAAGDASPDEVGGWRPTRIGSGGSGTITEDDRGWLVRGAGAGLRGNADDFFFALRPLESGGQVVARLEEFDGRHPESTAGLVLRDNLGEAAAYAFVGVRAGIGLCFQYRQIASGMTMRTTNVHLPMPVWLRLNRAGGSVSAEASVDGRQWQTVGKGNVNLGQFARAGMAVASGDPASVVSARFADPVVGARGVGYSAGFGYPRLTLRGGSVLIAAVDSADESVIRLGAPLPGAMVSTLNVSRIEYVPLTPEAMERLEPARAGVLFPDGDFIDGTLRRIATNSVTVNSLLFGFRQLTAGSEAALVQIGPQDPEDAAFRVVLQNGSELRARELTAGTNGLRAESPLLGSLLVPPHLVRTVRRVGPDR